MAKAIMYCPESIAERTGLIINALVNGGYFQLAGIPELSEGGSDYLDAVAVDDHVIALRGDDARDRKKAQRYFAKKENQKKNKTTAFERFCNRNGIDPEKLSEVVAALYPAGTKRKSVEQTRARQIVPRSSRIGTDRRGRFL